MAMQTEAVESSRVIERNAGKIAVGAIVAGVAVRAIGMLFGELGLAVFGDIVFVGGLALSGLGYWGRKKDPGYQTKP